MLITVNGYSGHYPILLTRRDGLWMLPLQRHLLLFLYRIQLLLLRSGSGYHRNVVAVDFVLEQGLFVHLQHRKPRGNVSLFE